MIRVNTKVIIEVEIVYRDIEFDNKIKSKYYNLTIIKNASRGKNNYNT